MLSKSLLTKFSFLFFAHIGFYRQHYVEYLVTEISKAKIDPLPILDLTDCVQELRRRGIALPERGPWDTDEIYKVMCAEVFNIFDIKVFKWNEIRFVAVKPMWAFSN